MQKRILLGACSHLTSPFAGEVAVVGESRTNAGEGLKRVAIVATLVGLTTFCTPANAEVIPAPSTIAPDTINLTQTTESTHSANYLILYDIDKTVSPWTSTPVYYDITLKKTEYGTGTPETPYSVKAPYANVTITTKGPSAGRNPVSPIDVLIHGESANDGGAIFNEGGGTISSINGDFIGNTATGVYPYGAGGAIYNSGTITSITGDFIGNTATNYHGGAIFNTGGTIGTITGDFIGNTADRVGGAIYNDDSGTIGTIEGDFIGNTGSSGGAIENNGTIGTITCDFIGNTTGSSGGAIFNGYRATITTITGDFIGNTANVNGGGAIYNCNTITSITGDFIGNTADRVGGAIYNYGGTMAIVDSNFTGNTAQVNGGAIATYDGSYKYDNSVTNIVAKNNDVVFLNNTANGQPNDIYNSGGAAPWPFTFSATLNLNTASGKNIILNGGIDGDAAYKEEYNIVNINKTIDDLPTEGIVVFNGAVKNQTLNMYNGTLQLGTMANMFDNVDMNMHGGTINSINNAVNTYNFTNLTVVGNTDVAVDVDLENAEMDRFTADNYGTHTGNINVVGMNLLTDAVDPDTPTTVPFADDNLKANVTTSVTQVGDGTSNPYQTTAFAPIYKYDVSYDPSNGEFGFVRSSGGGSDSFNPAVLAEPVAAQANIMAINNIVTNYAFHHVDTCMGHAHGRLSSRYLNRYAIAETDLIKDDLNTNNPLFIEPDKEAVWVKPFVTFENIPLKNGPKVNNITYGTLIGFDSPVFHHKRGFDGIWTGYVGYNGSNMHYSGVDSTSNGGLFGATYSLYKGNFFNATTVTTGAMNTQARTMYGNDNMTSLYAGIGNKTGYNFNFKEGLFTIQPSFLISYTFGKTFDYTNAAGVRIDSDPSHAIQLSPGIKFFMNTKNGWQPYIGVNMMWNIMDQTHARANGVKLPEMSVKPYVQYGIGVQKVMKDHFTAYGQAMIQNGGRNGISLTFGFKWALGKDKHKVQKVHTNGVRTVLKSK